MVFSFYNYFTEFIGLVYNTYIFFNFKIVNYIFLELVRAMKFVISQGWVMYWGTARWSPSEVINVFIIGIYELLCLFHIITPCDPAIT